MHVCLTVFARLLGSVVARQAIFADGRTNVSGSVAHAPYILQVRQCTRQPGADVVPAWPGTAVKVASCRRKSGGLAALGLSNQNV